MLILGKNSDDKGAQLEALTRQLLERKGYARIRKNEVGAGGHEIDVTADAPMPSLGQQQQIRRVICESKAQRNPIDMTQWLKFLGKVFFEEAEQGDNVTGYFIALSGINGNVAGNYNRLKARRSNIILLEGDDLVAEVSQLYSLCSLKEVETNLRRFTSRPVREYDVAYYDCKVYRVVIFENDAYTLLDATGQPLNSGIPLTQLREMIDEEFAVKAFVDLPQEAEARRRDTCAQLALLSQLMIDGGATTKSRVLTEVEKIEPCTPDELDRAIVTLSQRQWIIFSGEEVKFNELETTYERISQFIEIFSFLVSRRPEGPCNGSLFVRVFGCPYYDSHINQDLVNYIQGIQADLPLTQEEALKVQELCRLSPSALLHATQPDPNLVVHRSEQMTNVDTEKKEMFDKWGSSYLLRILYHYLMADFRRPGPRAYFYELRGLREIEITQVIRVKSQNQIELEDVLSERRGIVELAYDYLAPDGGGKYATVVALREGNPWDDH